MSGRALRRLPVLAHARYIGALPAPVSRAPVMNGKSKGKKHRGSNVRPVGAPVETWLEAMERVVQTQGVERSRIKT